MRDKLVELLKKADEYASGICTDYNEAQEVCADFLLAEGVIVLPCKLRDTVYCIRYDKARKPFIKPLEVLSITLFHTGGFALFTTRQDMLGQTVFLTREEAENALAEMIKEDKG